jgi:hypothetical protein
MPHTDCRQHDDVHFPGDDRHAELQNRPWFAAKLIGKEAVIDLSMHRETLSLIIPLIVGSVGVFLNFLVGELDRKKLVKTKSDRPYKFSFFVSVGIMIFAIILGGILNPQAVDMTTGKLPYVAAGVLVFVLVSWSVLKYSTRGFSVDGKKEPLIV